jgi:Protein of unknown function (DUF3309)
MNLLWLLVIILIVFAVGGAPGIAWDHGYGYAPSGIFTVIVVVLVILLLTGRL